MEHQHKNRTASGKIVPDGKLHPIEAYHKNPVTRACHNYTCLVDKTDKYKQATYQCEENRG
jgi:hypothetical protein